MRLKPAHILILILLAISGCSVENGQHTAEDMLKRVVTRYNYALIDAYGRQIYHTLREVTSADELRRVGIIVSSYLQSDQVMEAKLHRLVFQGISVDGRRATVETAEDWSYRWINRRTGEVVEPLKHIHYRMRYHLIMEEDRGWVVDRVEEIEHRLKGASQGDEKVVP